MKLVRVPVDPVTMEMDVAATRAAITPNTVASLPLPEHARARASRRGEYLCVCCSDFSLEFCSQPSRRPHRYAGYDLRLCPELSNRRDGSVRSLIQPPTRPPRPQQDTPLTRERGSRSRDSAPTLRGCIPAPRADGSRFLPRSIGALSELALQHGVGLHVDACLGGFEPGSNIL